MNNIELKNWVMDKIKCNQSFAFTIDLNGLEHRLVIHDQRIHRKIENNYTSSNHYFEYGIEHSGGDKWTELKHIIKVFELMDVGV